MLTVFSLWKNTRTHQKPSCGSLGGSGMMGTVLLHLPGATRTKHPVCWRLLGAQDGVQHQQNLPGDGRAAWLGSDGFCVTIPPSRGCPGDSGLSVPMQGDAAAGGMEAHPAMTSALRFGSSWSRFGCVCLRAEGSWSRSGCTAQHHTRWSLLPSLVLWQARGMQEPGRQPPLHGCAQILAPSPEILRVRLGLEWALSSAQAAPAPAPPQHLLCH